MDRVQVVLREDRPCELQDVDGTHISKELARKIIAEQFTVSDEVRKRNSKHRHLEQVEQRAEKNQKEEKPHQLVFPGTVPQASQVRGKP